MTGMAMNAGDQPLNLLPVGISAQRARADERQGMINHAADEQHFGTPLRFEKRDERTDGQ